MNDNLIKYFQKAIDNPNQSGKSTLVVEYEEALADFFSVPYVVAVNSGSAAIHSTLACLGARPGKKVIVCATAPLPTLMPIYATGAEILFADSMPNSPNIDPDSVKSLLLSNEVLAVVEVSIWGYPQDYKPLLDVLNANSIPLVEDASHSHGADKDGRYVGTEGTVGCFSTHQMKLLSTGEGGFVTTHSEFLFNEIKKFSRIGNLNGASPGLNFKISAFTAGVGLARLSEFESVLNRRQQNMTELSSLLKSGGIEIMEHIGQPNGYNVVIDTKAIDSDLIKTAVAFADLMLDTAKYGYKCGYHHQLFFDPNIKRANAEKLINRLIQFPTNTENFLSKGELFLNALR